MGEAVKKVDVETLKRNEAKWSKPLMAAGWTAIPSIIIEKQEALGLDAIDMNIIVHLTSYWWTAGNLPHPSVETIAKAVGIKERTVQKRIKSLQELGLVERTERRHTKRGSDTNLYGFNGLIKTVLPFAEEKLAQIAKRKAEEEERLKRKKPLLHIVSSSD